MWEEHALALDQKSCARRFQYRTEEKIFVGRPDETESSHCRGLAAQPARRDGLPLDDDPAATAKNYLGLYDQAVPWFLTGDRGQAKFSAPAFCVGRRARTARSTR